MSDDITFSVKQLKCNKCQEVRQVLSGESVDDWELQHIERHRKGKCQKCGHWNDEHRDSALFPEPISGYHKEPLICGHPCGMGDFCGCGTVKDE